MCNLCCNYLPAPWLTRWCQWRPARAALPRVAITSVAFRHMVNIALNLHLHSVPCTADNMRAVEARRLGSVTSGQAG